MTTIKHTTKFLKLSTDLCYEECNAIYNFNPSFIFAPIYNLLIKVDHDAMTGRKQKYLITTESQTKSITKTILTRLNAFTPFMPF